MKSEFNQQCKLEVSAITEKVCILSPHMTYKQNPLLLTNMALIAHMVGLP